MATAALRNSSLCDVSSFLVYKESLTNLLATVLSHQTQVWWPPFLREDLRDPSLNSLYSKYMFYEVCTPAKAHGIQNCWKKPKFGTFDFCGKNCATQAQAVPCRNVELIPYRRRYTAIRSSSTGTIAPSHQRRWIPTSTTGTLASTCIHTKRCLSKRTGMWTLRWCQN